MPSGTATSSGNTPTTANSSTATSTPAASQPSSTSTSRPSADVLSQELRTLSQSLQAIHATASHPTPERSLPHIPPELVQYVENGRNPDIYTREFVEQVRRGNQLLRGKQVAFGRFRDILAGEMGSAMPELREDVAAVLEATGGRDRWRQQDAAGGGGEGVASGSNGFMSAAARGTAGAISASLSFGQGTAGNGGSTAAAPSGQTPAS